MTKLRVFLADDHAMIRAGLKSLIEGDPAMTVVGEAAEGPEAVVRVTELVPDVLVLDVSMPKLGGVPITRQLKQALPQLKILALTVHEDRSYLREMLQAGASGYALKRAAAEELRRAIHVVATGGIYVDPSVAGELVKTFVHTPSGKSTLLELSDRETQVLRLLAGGYSTKEIAATMDISVKTVETYKFRSMEKLGLKSRVDIVNYAKRVGWFQT